MAPRECRSGDVCGLHGTVTAPASLGRLFVRSRRVWGGDPPIFVYRMRLWIRVRLVGALEQFGMLEHPKMRESILVAPRIPNLLARRRAVKR